MRFSIPIEINGGDNEKKEYFEGTRVTFSLTGITRVVLNSTKTVIDEKIIDHKIMKVPVKVRDPNTLVWMLGKTKFGEPRWFQYEWEFQGIREKIIDGLNPQEMHDEILLAMVTPFTDVWFSGNTCNITVDETAMEKQRQDEVDREKMRCNACKDVMKEIIKDVFTTETLNQLDELVGKTLKGLQERQKE